MRATKKPIVTASMCALLVGLPIASNAEIKIQNGQYEAQKDAAYVKGKLTGEGVVRRLRD